MFRVVIIHNSIHTIIQISQGLATCSWMKSFLVLLNKNNKNINQLYINVKCVWGGGVQIQIKLKQCIILYFKKA